MMMMILIININNNNNKQCINLVNKIQSGNKNQRSELEFFIVYRISCGV